MSHHCAVAIRKPFLLLAASFTFALLTACSSQTPENVVNDFLKALTSGRFDDACGYAAAAEKGDCQKAYKANPVDVNNAIKRCGEMDISTTLISKDANHARVSATEKCKKSGETRNEQWSLIKESGGWKLTFK